MVHALGRLKTSPREGSGWVSIFVLWLVEYLVETQALNFTLMAARDTRDEFR